MHKLAILSTLALSTLSYRPHKCPQDYLWTIEGCIKDCRSDLFANCPDFYTLQFEPNFCGLNQDGYWGEFTYQCQACSTPGIVGVVEGPCKEYQKEGLPVEGGVYVAEEKKKVAKPHYCPRKRPTEENCPTVNYFTIPQYDFCGLTYDGEKKQFDLSCSACKDTEIEYFYDMPCHNVGIESTSSILTPDQPQPQPQKPQPQQPSPTLSPQIPEPPTPKLTHSNTIQCFDDNECLNWQFCHQSKCLDRCAMMKCSSGDCRKGHCMEAHLRENKNQGREEGKIGGN